MSAEYNIKMKQIQMPVFNDDFHFGALALLSLH